MLLTGFPAQAFETNCYVIAREPGQECLVVDPGIGVLDRLEEVLSEHRLRPAAVLLTHGHLDHVYSVTPVCQGPAIPALIHGDDEYRLKDPLSSLGPGLISMLERQFGTSATWTEPSDVQVLTDREHVEIAGLSVEVLHAPGHTEGSAMLRLPEVPDVRGADLDLTSTVLTGDVVFAGSIGRTDLPGGSPEAMLTSLREVVLGLDDASLLLPGHGPATTMAHERRTNPYLLEVS
ncbi:MAG: MBL fold metallo-hydrolase [Actinomycetales bacterium]